MTSSYSASVGSYCKYYCPIKLDIDDVVYYINHYTFIFNGSGYPIYIMSIRTISKDKAVHDGWKSDYPDLSDDIKQKINLKLRKLFLATWEEEDYSLLTIEINVNYPLTF